MRPHGALVLRSHPELKVGSPRKRPLAVAPYSPLRNNRIGMPIGNVYATNRDEDGFCERSRSDRGQAVDLISETVLLRAVPGPVVLDQPASVYVSARTDRMQRCRIAPNSPSSRMLGCWRTVLAVPTIMCRPRVISVRSRLLVTEKTSKTTSARSATQGFV